MIFEVVVGQIIGTSHLTTSNVTLSVTGQAVKVGGTDGRSMTTRVRSDRFAAEAHMRMVG
jgi:hypothetical protein